MPCLEILQNILDISQIIPKYPTIPRSCNVF
jgi:hypothetical protein